MPLSPGEVVVRVIGSALGAHPGAEVVGTVTEAGAAAADWVGKTVLVPRLLPCGECGLCQRGRVASCPHLHPRGAPVAEEVLPSRFLLPLGPPILPAPLEAEGIWRYAALPDALASPYAGLVRAGQSPGELCVVLGGGFRAAAALLVIRALGCQSVVVCPDAAERKRLCTSPYHALLALDSLDLDPEAGRAQVRELAQGAGLLAHGICVLETTGSDAGRARALAMVELGGTAVLLDRSESVAMLGFPIAHSEAERRSPIAHSEAERRSPIAHSEAERRSSMAAPLPAGPGLAMPAALESLSRDEGQILGVRGAHPDLLPELLALVLRAGIDLCTLVTPVAPNQIDEILTNRRRGTGDRLTLPVVRYG